MSVTDVPDFVVPLAVALDTGGVTGQLYSRQCAIAGWSIREETGAAVAQFSLWTGTGTGGERLASVNLPAGGQASGPVAAVPVFSPAGVFFELRAGAVHGVVYVIPL